MTPRYVQAVWDYYENHAPRDIRKRIRDAKGRELVSPGYPYNKRLKNEIYEAKMHQLQIELVKMLTDVVATGKRVVVLFEGRDAAGKGGAISRMRMNLNPRSARVVALPKPSDRELGQWYLQRYISHLPTAGEIAFFDRSWYNRAVVEKVFGFCTPHEREKFFEQVPVFESGLVQDGTIFIKLWMTIHRAEQLRRMLDRANDMLKQWKLSSIDVEGLARWDEYTEAISEMFARSDFPQTPWTVILADDKRRARIAAIQTVLRSVDYAGRDDSIIGEVDPKICGSTAIWNA